MQLRIPNHRAAERCSFAVVLSFLFAWIVGCSRDVSSPSEVADASTASADASSIAPTAVAPALARAAELAAGDPILARRLEPSGDGLKLEDDGATSPGWRRSSASPASDVGAVLPGRIDQPLRVGIGKSDAFRLTLTHRATRRSRVVEDAGRAVYADALPSTDVIVVSQPDRLEWMYLMRDERAPREISLDLELGSALAGIRLENTGALLAHDANGQAMLRITRPYAIDAKGTRRDAGIEYRGGVVRLELDTSGLTYPVLLDPAIETAAWELKSSPPTSRGGFAMAYDTSRSRAVVFGGSGTSGKLGDTWEFDGTTWTLMSTTGPSARSDMGAAYDQVRQNVVMFGGYSGFVSLGDTWTWNGSVWTQACTSGCTPPNPRYQHSLSYDAGRGRTVMFGGFTFSYQQDTWEWNGTTWAPVTTATSPSARGYHALAYDPSHARTVLWGGFTGSVDIGDTWTYDGANWTLAASAGPPATEQARMVYYPASARVVLYGGLDYNTSTWEWNGTTWSTHASAANPGGRFGHGMVYLAAQGKLMVFAGSSLGDTWFWDNTNWTEPTNQPAPRYGQVMAYDSGRGRTVMFGDSSNRRDLWEWDGFTWAKMCTSVGCLASAPSGGGNLGMTFDSTRNVSVIVSSFTGQVWEWNGTVWTIVSPAGPTSRSAFSMAYDTVANRSLLFGGQQTSGSTAMNDLWAWNGTTWTQLCTTAACIASRPPARYQHVAAFDSNRGVMVIHGGTTTGSNSLSDVWEWNGTTQLWTQRCTAAPCNTTMPAARRIHGAAFDPTRGRVVLYGGYGPLGDTWEWDGTAGAFLRTDAGGTASSPSARDYFGFSDDRARRRVVLFGGLTGASVGDTWEYHVRGNACSVASQCSTGNCVDGVCCESLSCGTCQACNTAANPGVCSPVTNADDLDTCTGANTCDGLGQCRKKTGQSCSAGTECATSFCADSRCCNAACSGGCDECASSPGTCTPRAAGNAGSSPNCGGFACDGTSGACPTTCSSDAQCATGYFCAAGGTCQPRRAQGAVCNTASGGDCATAGCVECQSGLSCADFVCCNSTCGGTCAACNLSGLVGTCSTVTNADDDTCKGASTCSGAGACLLKNGQGCTLGTQCASGSCADNFCCNAACGGGCDVCSAALGASANGTCTVLPQGNAGASCGAYVCNGSAGACPTTCGSDADCATGDYCAAGGTCQPQKAQGASCDTTAGADCKSPGCRACASGNCVDGYCCNAACGGACDACNGQALGWSGATNGTCKVAPLTYPGNPVCVAYACDGTSTACATSCTSDQQCAGGYYCASNGTCQLQKAQGLACNLSTDCKAAGCRECTTGNCVDGFCCSSACAGACDVCSATPGTCTLLAAGSSGTPACSPYLCNGASASCGGSCTSDAQCVASSYCRTSDGTCQPDQGPGGACTSGAQCQTGLSCADGVCCDTTCTGACQACTAAKKGSGSNGTCGLIKAGTDPDGECATDPTSTCKQDGFCNGSGACELYASGTVCNATTCATGTQTSYACDGLGTCKTGSSTGCAPYVCASTTSCATTCTNDAGCVPTSWCRTSDSTCQPDQAAGAGCTSSSQCTSGNCVDGVCCDTACNGLCQACTASLKGSGTDGTCGSIKVGTDPQNECTDDGATSCQKNGFCSGTGTCTLYASGTTCGTTTCAGGTQTGYSCDGFGTCKSGNATSCAPYTCGATACLSTCSADTQCVATSWCRVGDGTCQPDQANGASCTASSQCTSGNCVDGFCCDAPCGGLCQACSAAKKGSGADGVCGNVKVDSDPDSECATNTASTCLQNGNCDGAGACKLWAPGTVCGATTCSSGTQTGYACDGFGVCKAGNTTPCAPYQCSGNACGTSCADDTGCIAADWCRTSDGTCQPDQAGGAACTSVSQCASGNCVDGFCCDSPCNGTCQACSAAKKGTGANGACGTVAAGTDPDNDCTTDATSTCKQTGFCSAVGTCALYPSGTSCAASSCAAGAQTGYSCDGLGACKGGTAVACAPYVCASATACATTCTTDAGCVTSSFCRVADGSCQPDQANGAGCTSASQCVSGSCVDGVCCDTPCGGLCQACTAALKGGGASGTCGSVAANTDPQNECPDDGAASCQRNGSCNGAGACELYSSGAGCAASTCSGTTQTGYACDGLGACKSGATTACDPFTCGTTACLSACTTDAGCIATYFCRISDGTCQPDQGNGAACTSSTQCVTGNCVDGVCCDSPCGGSCQACSLAKKGSGPDGTCGSIKVDTDPDNECTSAAASTCQQNGSCDGNGACKLWAPGTVCGATTCGNGTQTGYQCDGFGLCKSGNAKQCSPYTCSGNVCGTSCADDTGCIAASFCRTSDGSCQPDQANGAACTSSTQCASGNCVDGVCCDAPCAGTCQACSATKKGSGVDGVCGSIAVDVDPDNECATDAVSTCKQTGFCDGAGACKRYPLGTTCGATTCATGVQTGYQCDGFGTCNAGATTNCAPYTCADASACATACASDTVCVTAAFCDSGTGTCKGDQTNGKACTSASQCISGFCTDGVCCDQACGGLCQSCLASDKGAGQDGVCGSVKTATDPADECPDDGAASCQRNGSCNGAGACAKYAAGVACGASTCTSGTQTGYACNGLGTCASAASTQCAPYTCAGATCGSTCASDGDCIVADWCRVTDATCQPDQANGASCASATQCSSGNCIDGVCCDAPCGGTCQACSATKKGSGTDGVCGTVKAGTDPDNECNDDGAASCKQDGFCSGSGACRLYASGVACGATSCANGQQTGYACDGAGTCNSGASAACTPYVCNGGSCGVSCASDTDCVASAYCDGASHCVPDQANGATCTSASQCTSGFCTDGVCCDQACGGACQACSGAKKGDGSADGVCGSVIVGTDPDNDCAVEAPGTCQKDGQCDGAGACRLYGLGTACGANTCAGATLTGQQCDGFGTCVAGKQTACDPFVCVGSSCAISCADDSGCVATAYCGNNVCQSKVDNAQACAADHECKSGFCVEGLCCNTACNGVCQACTAANKVTGPDGVCGDAKAGVDPHSDCADDGQTTCQRDGKCDGNGACGLYAQGTACGTTSCVGNVQTGYACNGTGQCDPNATTDCGLLACVSGQCRTSCAAETDCASTAYCDTASSTCKPKDANGKACAGATTCESGYCVDGVCCDQACSGQCEACDVSTAKGKCSPVAGKPHGSRPVCAAGTGASGDAKCAARACDGTKSTASCVGYVGSDVACRDQSCANGIESFSATCNGSAQCGLSDEVQTKVCKPFACGTTGCKDKCAVDADCAVGFKCDPKSGDCISGATCDGDHTISAPGQPDTDCRPYKCEAGGTCKSSCASVDDCMTGFVCADGLCSTATTASAAADQGGGCGCRVGEQGGGRGAWALALAALLLARPRSRRRAERA